MFFSIIIPLYNKEAFVQNTILSVARQTFQDYELIIIDDCSTDQSLNAVNELVHENLLNCCTILKNETNRGVGFTRNRGLDLAKGDYILFIDADDVVQSEHFLANSYQILKDCCIDYLLLPRNYVGKYVRPVYEKVKSSLQHVSEDLYFIEKPEKFIIEGDFPFGGSGSAILSRHLIGDVRYKCNEKLFEDWLFYIPLFLKAKVYFYNYVSIDVHKDPQSLSRKNYHFEKMPEVYKFLLENDDYRDIRLHFFWTWYAAMFDKTGPLKDKMNFVRNTSTFLMKNMTSKPIFWSSMRKCFYSAFETILINPLHNSFRK